MSERVDRREDCIKSLVCQFGYWNDKVGGFTAGGLSALEEAFDILGWEDPHPCPECRCDEPGCMKQASCGTPTPTGYRSVCGDHYRKLTNERLGLCKEPDKK